LEAEAEAEAAIPARDDEAGDVNDVECGTDYHMALVFVNFAR
jgi:hypothetical protein